MSSAPDTLVGLVQSYAQTIPDEVALREKRLGVWSGITWREYYEAIEAVAWSLAELGVGPGDHVGILSDNCPQWLYADLAVQALGARSVGIYQTNPPSDVAYCLSHSQAKVLFCEDQEQVDKAIDIRDETPTVQTVVVFDPRGTRHYNDGRLVPWSSFLSAGKEAVHNERLWFSKQIEAMDSKAPAMIIYTSGTTGQPKGAMISNRNVLDLAEKTCELLGVQKEDTLLSYLPLCHVAEKIFSLFVPLSVGAVVHFGESIGTVRADLQEVSPSIFLGVPRIWEKIHANVHLKMKDASWLKRTLFEFFTRHGERIAQLRQRGTVSLADTLLWKVGDLLVFRALQERLGLRRCRLPVTGAAPIAPEIIQWFHGIGVFVLEGYGQTECAGVSHTNPPDNCKIGTVGVPLPGVECVLAQDGEILLRGANVFCGYLHNEEATKETVDSEGWLHTGDIGSIDEAGFLRITGRKKEIIITAGGKNLSPEKIENCLKLSPYIKEAVSIGDKRKFVSALVQIDYEAVGDWASRRGIAYTSFEDLVAKGETEDLITHEIHAANESLAQVEQVRAFRLFKKELHQDDGELTPTQKLKRGAVTKIYSNLIESMYGG